MQQKEEILPQAKVVQAEAETDNKPAEETSVVVDEVQTKPKKKKRRKKTR